MSKHQVVPIQTPIGEQHFDAGAIPAAPPMRVILVPADADTIEKIFEWMKRLLDSPQPR